MDIQLTVRYGSRLKLILAMVLPGFLIIPFIFLMQNFKALDEWKIWVIIFSFLAVLMAFTLWLVLQLYPTTVLRINPQQLSLSFNQAAFLSPANFSCSLSNMVACKRGEKNGAVYYLIETRNPTRKFQLSASSNNWDAATEFDQAMQQLAAWVSEAGDKAAILQESNL